ncbi:hypothetical protein AKJ16_DCAP24202 [Drosera capensis]
MLAATAQNSPLRLHHHYRDHHRHLARFQIRCSDPKPRGFGPKDNNVKNRSGAVKEQKESASRQRKSVSGQSGSMPGQAPGLSSMFDGNRDSIPVDRQFEERLEAVISVIDYDAPVEAKESPIGLGTKTGVGVAVVAFGVVFAFGDFLPSGSVKTTEAEKPVTSELSEEERATLEARLQQYEKTLGSSSKDLEALEASDIHPFFFLLKSPSPSLLIRNILVQAYQIALSNILLPFHCSDNNMPAELEQYDKAASLLEDLAKEKPLDPEVYRLLGEVKYELKEYEASAAAYKKSAEVLA